jgi:hypothetical protein
MFSSDITKIRLAELKAKGDGGTIQRLRKSCDDAAAVMEHAAKLIAGQPLKKDYRVRLAHQLLRGSKLLRGMGKFSAPKGLDAARVAELAHKALNTKNTKNSDAVGAWVQALMEIRTAARASLNLPPIPKGTKGDG